MRAAFYVKGPLCKKAAREAKSPSPFGEGLGVRLFLEIERPMSHAAGSAQRCAQCGEETYQNLNHHFPF